MAGLESIKSLRYRFKYFGPGTLIVILSFVAAFHFMKPAPPRNLVIGTGGSGGAYFRYGKEFKKILARDGIQLEVRTTEGAVDNLHLLEAGEIDIAFMQGGVGSKATTDDLISLGSLYYEPIWGFYLRDKPITTYRELKGLRIGTGGKGSATNSLALKVLPLLGISEEECNFVEVHGSQGADTRDDLDAVSKTVPVMAIHQSGHLAAINSKGLEVAGITAVTKDPAGGVYRRREGGSEPDGVLEEMSFFKLVFTVLGKLGAEDNKALLKAGLFV